MRSESLTSYLYLRSLTCILTFFFVISLIYQLLRAFTFELQYGHIVPHLKKYNFQPTFRKNPREIGNIFVTWSKSRHFPSNKFSPFKGNLFSWTSQ